MEAPTPLYLSTYTPEPGAPVAWTVILNGCPIMADTRDKSRAVAMYADARRQRRNVDPEAPRVWDGDVGRFL
jgi:hypothetical protein